MYRVSAAVFTFGEMKFKQRPREEQADIDGAQGKALLIFFTAISNR